MARYFILTLCVLAVTSSACYGQCANGVCGPSFSSYPQSYSVPRTVYYYPQSYFNSANLLPPQPTITYSHPSPQKIPGSTVTRVISSIPVRQKMPTSPTAINPAFLDSPWPCLVDF